MHWLVLAMAIVLGGIIHLCNKNDNKILKAISFVVPFSLGVLFWIMLYNTGYHITFYSTYAIGVESHQGLSKILMILLTSCMIAGVSWGFGEVLGIIIDSNKKTKR